jgi:glycosyltransferase involved in cell wall biosynthesis
VTTRVTHICGGSLTGSTRVVLNLLRHHRRELIEPSVCFYAVRPPDQRVLDEVRAMDVQYESVVKRGRYDMLSIPRLARAIARLAPDVVAAHGFGACASGLPAAKLARVPKLVRVEHAAELYTPLHRAAARMTAPLADSTILVSRFLGRYLAEQGVSVRDAEVIYNGVDLAPLLAVNRPVLDGSRPATILMVARMDEGKDHATLLEAVAQLHGRGVALRLRLAHSGPREAALQGLAASLGIGAITEFVGYQPDMAQLLAEADIAVLSTAVEGFGLVVVEAMAAARPAIATDAGSLPEILDSEEHGLLVPPGSVHALADAINRLVADPARARAVGEAGRRVARERYSLDTFVRAHERHLLRTTGQAARGWS